jgi:uncharacterized protein (DUF1810 family)
MDNLHRFIDAQDDYGFSSILEEIRNGQKTGHWMWFIFPQLRGLGKSHHSHYYGISSFVEAKAYWAHPVLGLRLRECFKSILNSEKTALEIFGVIDMLKLHSCVTLFIEAADDEPILYSLLDEYFKGQLDEKTIDLIDKM